MDIGETLSAASRADWRSWLERHHANAAAIWLVLEKQPGPPDLSYLDAVEEGLCFGWIDGISKPYGEHARAQRFTPRRRKSNWTELNKERARRLIALGLMTPAGRAVLPDLDEPFRISAEVERALRADANTWAHFESFPKLYQRIRVGYVQEMIGRPDEYEKRLDNFLKQTSQGRMFGNWTDGGRLGGA